MFLGSPTRVSEAQVLKQEVAALRKQLQEQKDLTAEYRKLHQSASIRKQELFRAIQKLQGVLEEALEA
jgi:hypothetical protein